MMNILTIAGSDSSGGAGIQGDLKTITAHGAHGLTVITAITAQNTRRITSIFPVENVKEQLVALMEDIEIHGIKIGMLYTVDNVKVVIDFLKSLNIKSVKVSKSPYVQMDKLNEQVISLREIPVVIDPLMISSTNKPLVSDEALELMMSELFGFATLITPNVNEAKHIGGMDIHDHQSMETCAKMIYDKIYVPVLIKGGHLEKDGLSTDIYYDGNKIIPFSLSYEKACHTHGTGCCLSSAITCRLAEGKSLEESMILGKLFVTRAIKNGYPLGKGEGPVDPIIHFITNYVTMNDVANCCMAAGGRPIMAEAVEEMEDIVPWNNGLLINLGTMNKGRVELMETALSFVPDQHPVLLDPVGCGSSFFRLNVALNLLKTGKISFLKLNSLEGIALLNESITKGSGVDSIEIEIEDKQQLAKSLVDKYITYNKKLIVIVTGVVDVVADKNQIKAIYGGTKMQQKITGTGCMLNSILLTFIAKSRISDQYNADGSIADQFNTVIKAIKHMNVASERATYRISNKNHIMSYKQLLIDEISSGHKQLYLITDEKLEFDKVLLPKTERALKLGVTMVQYRVKDKKHELKLREARALRDLTEKYGVTFIINDDIQLAKEVNADGVHLGIKDKSIAYARDYLGESFIIGATAKTVDQALKAMDEGANYLGVGALNPSPTKPEAIRVSATLLQDIKMEVSIPIYGIGGIRSHNLTQEQLEYVDGIALVSAVYEGGEEEIKRIKIALERGLLWIS
jgi:hydroxymethylpyrimidine/phosphomethylpyrimidine kinase